MKALHILYSGDSRGGAQDFALQFAVSTKCKTSSIRAGDFAKKITDIGCDYVDSSLIKSFELESYYIIASDPRSFVTLICRGIRVNMLFLHSNNWLRPLRFIFLYSLLWFSSTRLVVTTPQQFEKFHSLSPARISPIKRMVDGYFSRQNKEYLGFIYFGRFSKEKRIDNLVQQWIRSGVYKKFGAFLTLVGEEYPSLTGYQMQKYNINLVDKWLDKHSLNKIIQNHNIVVNNCLNEGLSIQLVEGVSHGLVPLVASADLHSFYFGDGIKQATIQEGFSNYCQLSDFELESLYNKASGAIKYYLATYKTDYEDFLNDYRE